MTSAIEYNARSIPASRIAKSFIPPERHFQQLLSNNHTLILGPRGSGKTTLLKMLTVRALREWEHAQAPEYSRQISFNGVFVAADIAWGRQIDALEGLGLHVQRKEAAFVLHTLRALVHAMREAVDLSRSDPPSHLEHLSASMSEATEEQFVKIIAPGIGISPIINTILGLELGIEARLNQINKDGDDGAFSVGTFPSTVSHIISAFNALSGSEDRRWALLFDELEIAPTQIKQFLLSGIRSFDERIIIKLAMAPYMEDVGFERTPISAHPLHDYQTIPLSYANKEDARDFTIALFVDTFERLGIDVGSLGEAFPAENAVAVASPGRRGRRQPREIPPEFMSLVEKDESFRDFVDSRGIFRPDYIYSENNLAKDVRKVLPIVRARDYYLRSFIAGRYSRDRSRKAHELYTGYPAITEITEGNPRAILTFIGPLVQEFRATGAPGAFRVPPQMQGRAVKRVELLLTSLLQVIPLDLGGFERGKGLLDFVDQIGRTLEDKLLRREFKPDYVGTFTLDENVTQSAIGAVGKALNAGAIVHVPFADSSHDALLRGLVGQRFRLSYALASRYRLLLTLGEPLNLSKLLFESRSAGRSTMQASLFELGEGA